MSTQTKKIDRVLLKALRTDLDAALKVIAEKHGLLAFTAGTMRFDDMTVKVTLNGVAYPTDNGKPIEKMTISASDIGNLDFVFNPSAPLHTYIGKEFRVQGTLFTVVEIKESRPKFPIIGKNGNGTRYKFTREQLLAGLVKK